MSLSSNEKSKRPFKIVHESLVLTVDVVRQSIEGYADLKLQLNVPLKKLGDIKLNSRQCNITQVQVNSIETQFELWNFIEQPIPDEDTNNISIDYYTDFFKAGVLAGDEGELVISLPPKLLDYPSSSLGTDLSVRIYYQLLRPKGAVHFMSPDKAYPNRFPHMYTDNTISSCRSWFPCVDTVTDRHTFDLQITVHSSLVVVATGDLYRQTLSQDRSKRTFYYNIDIPTLPSSIGLSIGPFEILDISSLLKDNNNALNNTPASIASKLPMITGFCLPNRHKELNTTTTYATQQALLYFEEYLGASYPFKSLKLVFVENSYFKVNYFSTLGILSSHLLYDDTIINQVFKSRYYVALSIAYQWFSQFIGIRSYSDLWIVTGIAGYLADLFFKKIFGINEYRFKIWKDMEYVAKNDKDFPLYHTNYIHPQELQSSKLFMMKSSLVIYSIEKRIGPDALRKVLSSLLTSSPTENRDIEKNLSTKKFIKIIKKVTGHDLRSFADRWVYGKGSPNVSCGFVFNKKKHIIEFALKQNKRTSGSLIVRVNELEGDTYDHIISFDEDIHTFEFPCYSRVRKARKKKGQKGEEQTTAASEDTADNEEAKKTETPVQWVRVDPELDSIRYVTMKQPEFMWINQLQKDNDIIAQLEAIDALRQYPHSYLAIEALNKILIDPHIYYRVRIQAAHALAKATLPVGVDLLVKYFKTSFVDNEGNQIKPNDFNNLIDYYLQMGLESAISTIRGVDGKTPNETMELMMDVLKNNDNSLNSYSDNYYISNLLLSLINLDTGKPQDTQSKIIKHIERYLSLEQILPSYHNTITVSCLQALAKLQLSGRMKPNIDNFKEYTKYGHYDKVRSTALKYLIQLSHQFKEPNILPFIVDSIEKDPSLMKYKFLEILLSIQESSILQQFQKESQENIQVIRKLWVLLNSVETSYDIRQRILIRKVFITIWGPTLSKLLGNKESMRKIVIRKQDASLGLSSKPPTKRRPLEGFPEPPPPPLPLQNITSTSAPHTPNVTISHSSNKSQKDSSLKIKVRKQSEPPSNNAPVASTPIDSTSKHKRQKTEPPPTPLPLVLPDIPKDSNKSTLEKPTITTTAPSSVTMSLKLQIPKDRLRSKGSQPIKIEVVQSTKPTRKYSKVRIRLEGNILVNKELSPK